MIFFLFLHCDELLNFLFLESVEDLKASAISFFESSTLFFKVFLISPVSIKFFAVSNASFLADLFNFLPIGLLAVLLIIEGVDLITAFPVGSKVLNNELKTLPTPFLFVILHLYDMEVRCSYCCPFIYTTMIQIQMYTVLTDK